MLPLRGLRLVSLALNVPGPVAVARLVAEGVSAVKIEPPQGDPLAALCRPWYDALHVGVTVMTADLKTETGRTALDAALAQADVLLTSHRPSSLARLGLAPAPLRDRFPELRTVAVVGDTAAPERAGHDVTYQADAGLLQGTLPATLLADMAGAEAVVAAVLLVLHDSPGTARTVGLRDVVTRLAEPRRRGLTMPGGLLGGALPAYGVYRAADGDVAVAALEPHFRARLYAVLGLPFDAPVAEVIATRTVDEWLAVASEHDLPIAAARRRG